MVERIFSLMEKNRINATELSKVTGVGTTTISAWKKGLQKPSSDAIIKIADYFNVTTDYLLTGKQTINHSHLQLYKNSQEEKILENLRQLNEDGKKDVCKYIEICVASGKYAP